MRFLATGEEMQKIDQISIEQIGIPGLVLMERAALAVTEEIEKRFSRIKTGEHDTGRTAYTRILVVTERGNNGGDGLAVARMLAEKGYLVDVYCIGQVSRATESYKVQESILGQLGIKITEDFPNGEYDVIVDAIFGVGLKRDIEGIHKEVIDHINDMPAYVVAVDIPSGIGYDRTGNECCSKGGSYSNNGVNEGRYDRLSGTWILWRDPCKRYRISG